MVLQYRFSGFSAYALMSMYDVTIKDINETLRMIDSEKNIKSLSDRLSEEEFNILCAIFENDGLKIDYKCLSSYDMRDTCGKSNNINYFFD